MKAVDGRDVTEIGSLGQLSNLLMGLFPDHRIHGCTKSMVILLEFGSLWKGTCTFTGGTLRRHSKYIMLAAARSDDDKSGAGQEGTSTVLTLIIGTGKKAKNKQVELIRSNAFLGNPSVVSIPS